MTSAIFTNDPVIVGVVRILAFAGPEAPISTPSDLGRCEHLLSPGPSQSIDADKGVPSGLADSFVGDTLRTRVGAEPVIVVDPCAAAVWDRFDRELEEFDAGHRCSEPEPPAARRFAQVLADVGDNIPVRSVIDGALFVVRSDELYLDDGLRGRCTEAISERTAQRRLAQQRTSVKNKLRTGHEVDTAIRMAQAERTNDLASWVKVCVVCHREFEAKKSNAMTCTPRCRKLRSKRGRNP